MICQNTRTQLKMASQEVQRQIKIITSTRKKQHCLALHDLLSKMKQVQDLPAALRCVEHWKLRQAHGTASGCMLRAQRITWPPLQT